MPVLVLPSGLRTGGATFAFQSSGEDLPRLLWKGRWRDVRMLGIYVQELGAAMIRMRLGAAEEELISELEGLYGPLFEAEVSAVATASLPTASRDDHRLR